jgi:hypothetical protein
MLIHIKYFNSENSDFKEIQVGDRKENAFKIIYQIINQKIMDKQSISLEQLIIFCSFKSIKKIRSRINYQEIQNESIKEFYKNKSRLINFKNLKTITMELIVDDFPKNVINFSI